MMQASSSSRESSPSPAPEKEPSEVSPGKQGRQRSSSISQRISMLTQVSGENDVFEKKELAVVVVPSSRRILEITQDFEKKKKKEGEGERRPGGGPGRRKRRSSSASKSSSASRSDDSPKILSPPKSSSKRSVAQENGVPRAITTKRPGAAPSVVMETYTSLESEIEEGLGEVQNASSSDPTSGQACDTKTQEEGSVCEKVEDVEKEESATKRSESSSSTETASERVCVAPAASTSSVSSERELTTHSGTAQCETVAVGDSQINDDVAAKSTILETSSETATATQAEGTQKRTALRKPASVSSLASGSVAMRTESTSSSDVMLSPAMEGSYRFRSVSDVSHDTRKLSSYRRDGSVSSGSMREMDGDRKDQPGGVPLKQGGGKKKKRTTMSVADPTDILTNLHLIPLDQSSELTQGLALEDVRRLNLKRTDHLPSPPDRLRLFSFSRRHLRLPFSLGRGKKQVKLASPDKTSPKRRGSKSDMRSRRLSRNQPDHLLCHTYASTSIVKGMVCGVCQKGFTGFMKHSQRCTGCGVVVHKHCENRSPPCKARIESGSYVTMSRKKIVKALGDLDDLAQFLLNKISMLHRDGCADGKVDKVFEAALLELHHSLVSNYSLTLQKSLDVSDQLKDSGGTKPPPSPDVPQSTEPDQRVTITFAQLVNNFTNIFKGIAKRQGLGDPGYLAISVNQMKTFLDEFSKLRRKSMVKAVSGAIEPATLRRKTFSGQGLELVDHNGHKFFTEQFKVATVCEYCNDPIPLLEKGEVCIVCGYTCHQSCLKLTTGLCEGKERAKSPPATTKPEAAQSRSQYGVALDCLVPPNTTQVPAVLEKCLQYIEEHGLYVQGIYRKSPGASSKRAVKATLEDDPFGCSLDGFHVNAVAAAVGAFFRELPTPLIPRDRYTDFLRTVDLTDREERLEALHHLLTRLPHLNYAVFERLMFHLARVAEQEPTNRMGPYNLAVIFAPCIFQGEAKSRNPQDLIRELTKQTKVLELIIAEQMEKLQATLRGIETLSVVARHTATKLTELMGSEESTTVSVSGVQSPAHGAGGDGGGVRSEDVMKGEEEDERERLTSELQEIERERVELTVNLPKLEPFTRDHHASWVVESRSNSPSLEHESSLPSLSEHTLLPALTKNRVSQKPKSRLPTRRPGVKGESDESAIHVT